MRHYALAAMILTTCTPATAHAQDPAEVCLPEPAHRAILADLLELQGDPENPDSTGLRGRVKLQDVAINLHAAQVVDLGHARDLAVQAKEAAQKSLVAAIRGKREAEESRDAWYRAPALWLGVGVLGSLVIAITVDKIQE